MSAPRLSEAEKQAILADYEAGKLTLDQIAAKHKIDRSYPALLAKRRGIFKRRLTGRISSPI